MKKYMIMQSFHLGEISKDLQKNGAILFDELTGNLKIGEAAFTVRPAPIVGAIKKGWLVPEDQIGDLGEVKEVVKFDGVEESLPIPSSKEKKKEAEKKLDFSLQTYEEDSRKIKPGEPEKELVKKVKTVIGRENREDEASSILLSDVKKLANQKPDDLVKTWNLKEHWARRKKKLLDITDVDILSRLLAIDHVLEPYIKERLKQITLLGTNVDHNLNALKSDQNKIEILKEDKSEALLGKDFEQYKKDQIQAGNIETK